MKRNKGITLIALVITIIILIILAAVSINLVMGENGILTRTQSSALQYTVSEIQENLEMVKGPIVIDGKRINLEHYLEELQSSLGTKYNIVEVENNGVEAKITIDGKYNFLLKDTQDNNVEIIYEGNMSELVLSANSATIKSGKSATFTVTENKSGGTLSVESENNDLVTATLNGNEVTVNVNPTIEEATQVKLTVKSAPNGKYGEEKVIFIVIVPATDKVLPTATITIADGITSETLPITAQVTVAQSDNENLAINSCKYVLNTSSTNLGTNAESYTGGTFTSDNETLNLDLTNAGTYYLHVLSVDGENNKKETIKPIVVEARTGTRTQTVTENCPYTYQNVGGWVNRVTCYRCGCDNSGGYDGSSRIKYTCACGRYTGYESYGICDDCGTKLWVESFTPVTHNRTYNKQVSYTYYGIVNN